MKKSLAQDCLPTSRQLQEAEVDAGDAPGGDPEPRTVIDLVVSESDEAKLLTSLSS
eukprot:COSAG02_NODE_2399_length_8948_cov_21.873771_10_plen_56_part_00